MTQPLFTDEGPQYYDQAYAHNRPFATPGPYNTTLSPAEELTFRRWVQTNGVAFDVNAPVSDYDMRGYWKDSGGKLPTSGERGMKYAWEDTYKTPYDTTFSAESRYATANNPFKWQGDNLIDTRDNSVVFGTPTGAAPSSSASGYGTRWHMEAQRPDGSTRVVQASLRSTGGGETHWDAELLPGESLRVVSHGGSISTD